MALIHPYDEKSSGTRNQVDDDLEFYRVKATSRKRSRFVPLHSIVRGALLVPDFAASPPSDELLHYWNSTPAPTVERLVELTRENQDEVKEYLVVDTIDGDMFIRIREQSFIGCRKPRLFPFFFGAHVTLTYLFHSKHLRVICR